MIDQKRKKLEREFHASTAFLTVPEDDSPNSQAKRAAWQSLCPLQRALMATDGSFTLLLAALHGEAIRTELIEQKQSRIDHVGMQLQLELEKGDTLLRRTVVLKTVESNRPVAYAESSIVLSRLSLTMRRDLLENSKPVGLLLRREALETHRRLEDWGVCSTHQLPTETFGKVPLLFRTYLIITHAMPIMAISEYFPYVKEKGGAPLWDHPNNLPVSQLSSSALGPSD